MSADWSTPHPLDPHPAEALFEGRDMQQKALELYNKTLLSLNVKTPKTALAQNRLSAINLFKAQYGEIWLRLLAGAFKHLYGHWVNSEPPEQAIHLVVERLNDSWLNSAYRGMCYAN